MNDTSDTDREAALGRNPCMTDGSEEMRDWFLREVLPLETALTQYLRHNWQDRTTVADLVQGVYMRVYEAASTRKPDTAKSFVFTIAHNLLVDRVRREKVIPIEAVDNLEALGVAAETRIAQFSLDSTDFASSHPNSGGFIRKIYSETMKVERRTSVMGPEISISASTPLISNNGGGLMFDRGAMPPFCLVGKK